MYSLITSTWSHSDSYNVENTILYKTFVRYNSPEKFINFHFNRGCFNQLEANYFQRMETQSEYILYKVDLLREKIKSLTSEYVVFCDANDVYCTSNLDHIFNLFDLDKYVVFSSERNDWPKQHMISHWNNYRNYSDWDRSNRMFLNSGVQLAKKSKYLELLDSCMDKFVSTNPKGCGGDQGVFTWHYNMIDEPKILLDYANIFALSTYDSNIDDYYKINNKVYSKKYGTSPIFIHDSGANYGGQNFGIKFQLPI